MVTKSKKEPRPEYTGPFRIIEGKHPTQKEMGEWSNDKWLDLLRFGLHFIEASDKRKGINEVFKCDKERMESMEAYLTIPNHPYHEFIYRINQWADRDNPRAFYFKFSHFIKQSLTYLKRHPAKISEEMRTMIEPHQRFNWCLKQYTVQTLKNGDEIVQRDLQVLDGNDKVNTKLPSLQAKMMTSLIEVADLYEQIAKSISRSEVKDMPTSDKIKALNQLSFIFQAATKKMGPNSFTQINIHGSAKEMEQAMLDYVTRQQK